MKRAPNRIADETHNGTDSRASRPASAKMALGEGNAVVEVAEKFVEAGDTMLASRELDLLKALGLAGALGFTYAGEPLI